MGNSHAFREARIKDASRECAARESDYVWRVGLCSGFAGFCKSGWFGFVIQSMALVIPCHRVVRSNGHIGPYSAGWNIHEVAAN